MATTNSEAGMVAQMPSSPQKRGNRFRKKRGNASVWQKERVREKTGRF